MISVCSCAINAKFDVELFARALKEHNKDVEFEIIITHDDRVNDGSSEYFANLQKEIPQLKIVKHTHQDTVEYLEKLLNYYEEKKLFTDVIRRGLESNLEKFRRGVLFNSDASFLWLTSGLLYNKAVQASTGDLLIITPSDFVYLFKLKDLENFVNSKKKDGMFYGKPNAIWARMSNEEPTWLKEHVEQIHKGVGHREGYRWDSDKLFRDYLKNPQTLNSVRLPDFKNNRVTPLSEFNDFQEIYQFNRESFSGGVQVIPSFHGYHVMTPKTYNAVGGFTEEFYGRAFADDKMTNLGNRSAVASSLPHEFSVAWCGQSELVVNGIRPYEESWETRLLEVDPLAKKHPRANIDMPTYLHTGLLQNHEMHAQVAKTFSQSSPPVRIL